MKSTTLCSQLASLARNGLVRALATVNQLAAPDWGILPAAAMPGDDESESSPSLSGRVESGEE
jgi:hypothetical protein